MTRRGSWGLLLAGLCMLAACGPGVRSDFPSETPDPGVSEHAPAVEEVTTRWVDAEATAMELRVRGRNFSSRSTVRWREQALTTTFLGDTELSAVLPLNDAVSWTEAWLDVRDDGSSNRYVLPYPEPELLSASLEPEPLDSVTQGRFILTGRNLVTGSHVTYDEQLYPVTVRSTERADVELPFNAVLESMRGGLQLQLQTSRPQPQRSNTLTVRTDPPIVEFLGVSPSSLSTAGGNNTLFSALVLYVKNARFVTQVKWNGQPVQFARYTDGSALYLPLPQDARSKPGLVTLTLEAAGMEHVPAPYLLPIEDAPVVHRLVTPVIQTGSQVAWLTLQGEGWGSAVDVSWDDQLLELQHGSSGDVAYVSVPSAEMARPGLHSVRVRRKSDGALSRPHPVEVVDAAPAPGVLSLEPSVVSVGESPVRLRVHGNEFGPTSVIRIDGRERVSQNQGAYSISTLLEPGDLAEAGIHTVTVSSPGGGTSLPLLLNVDARRPAPHLASLSVPFATVGSGPMSLSVSGAGLGAYSVIRWNGAFLTTRWEPCCNGQYRLVADIPSDRLAQPGVARVTVFNPPPGGGASNAIDFAILAPGASAPELTPRSIELGSPNVTVTVRGGGFSTSTFVMVGSNSRTATFIDSTTVTVKLEAWELATERTLELQAVTPRPEGSVASASQFLHVIPPRTPVLRSVIPGVVSVGHWKKGEVRSLDLRGENFDSTDDSPLETRLSASLQWGNAAYPVQVNYGDWHSGEGPLADVPGEAVANPGAVEVRVSRASENGGTSLPALVNVVTERPVPRAFAVWPGNLRMGADSQLIRIEGSNLHASSVVRWNGQPLTTMKLSETFMGAVVPGALVASPTTARVTVETPAPGGGVSLALPVMVQ
ncbi:hypothetical protein HPC49_26190 [Pyxidicoccus fallax]|uniref:IPT/TIG domain-containing protein n=1 Tax=Pyxidicoccus fallax TaxID=394095 RepID=A0A848LN66_9BACT|nr:hypothetical protein [Pyxidicoccus fallax]NMO19102.1 hypothetical protein [Pyxidicoccus fallax]NPC81698.1 hypothetical protein [Pyxidicoccus fallax]